MLSDGRLFHKVPPLFATGAAERMVVASALALISLVSSGTARATFIDPNFAVCPSAASDASACGADPNPISGTDFKVGVIGGAGSGPLNPILILMAIPDMNGATSLPYTVPVSTVAAPGPTQYGGAWNTTTGYVGEFTSGVLYDFAGLSGANNSESFVNFSNAAEQLLLGLNADPSSYAVYVYEASVPGGLASLGTNGLFDIPWTTGVPLGTYVAAYGIEQWPEPDKGNDHVYDSAFTVSGWVDGTSSSSSTSGGTSSGGSSSSSSTSSSSSSSSSTSSSSSSSTSGGTSSGGPLPEPATLALMGLGLVGLAATRRRIGV